MASDGIAIINLDDPAIGAMTPTDRETWTHGMDWERAHGFAA